MITEGKMLINLFDVEYDHVIESQVVNGVIDYDYALKNLHPLIGRLDIQRDALKSKLYTRLEEDILRGCVMPTITIALIETDKTVTEKSVSEYIENNISSAFILDGIQRLNTLGRASEREGFDKNRKLHVNFIVASSRDRLLYRMITLNNGQKAMSARHQIEILADSFFIFDDVDIKLVSEKGKGRVRAPETFKKADFVKGYIAYLSKSVNIDNQKIIEDKMDELIASRIIESNIPVRTSEFADVATAVNKFSEDEFLHEWIRNQNNFIGFCVGCNEVIDQIFDMPLHLIRELIETFEEALKGINISKVKAGRVRRETVAKLFENLQELLGADEIELLDRISDWI